MRAREFITEQKTTGLTVSSYSLPNTFVMSDLENQDFYEIYRFGLAIADVRGTSGDDGVQNKHRREFDAESEWGEKLVVTSFDPDVEDVIDKALVKVKKHGKKAFSGKSQELPHTGTKSPVKPFKGYKK